MSREFEISSIIEGNVKGEAIVSPMPISFLGEIDPKTGKVTSPQNPLHGKSISGKVLVMPESRGSTVGSYVILALKENGKEPVAIIVKKAETIVTVGAILAEIPLVTIQNEVFFEEVKNGDLIEIEAKKGKLNLYRDKTS